MSRCLHAGKKGSVLIVVLWASLGLVSVALLFGHSMLLAYRGADDDLSGRQADQAIEGAVRYAETLLTNLESPGGFPDLTSYGSEAMLVGDATFWFLGRADQTGTGLTRDFGLIDEASKLNLNTAQFDQLKALPGMTEEVAAAIVDWRDADETITPGGAESETYMRRQPGYSCKNAPFESIEELALVSGVTREILYGEDANMNGVLDPNEDDGDKTPPSDNADGKLDRGILEYVTVFSSEPKTRSDGTTPRIDVGQDPQLEQSLETMLTETLGDAARAKKILDPLRPIQPLPSPLAFYIISKERGGNDAMTAAEFDQIAVNLTMTPSTPGPPTFYPSPVNVNTASEAVLACIPGILVRRTRWSGDSRTRRLRHLTVRHGAGDRHPSQRRLGQRAGQHLSSPRGSGYAAPTAATARISAVRTTAGIYQTGQLKGVTNVREVFSPDFDKSRCLYQPAAVDTVHG